MQHTINDMAKYIKNIIPPTIPEVIDLHPMFIDIAPEENMQDGILAYRDLLYLICDQLIEKGHFYDKVMTSSKNTAHLSLPVGYPFLNNIKSILFMMGYHGRFVDHDKAIVIDEFKIFTTIIGAEGMPMKTKISGPKLVTAIEFLTSCGFIFDKINLEAKPSEVLKAISVKISFTKNPHLFVALKAMAIAQRELYEKGKHNIFLRCDYRQLKNEATETRAILKDFITPLSQPVQDFITELHQQLTNAGLTCKVDVFYLNIRFIYSYKRKDICTFSAAHESGYRLLIKAQKTELYPDTIDTFNMGLQETIARGYGCDKKLFNEPCQKGCHGYSLPLDDAIIDTREDIKKWLDNEVSYVMKKK